MTGRKTCLIGVSALALMAASPALADEPSSDLEQRILQLEKVVAAQQKTISSQQQELTKHQIQLQVLRSDQLNFLRAGATSATGTLPPINDQTAQDTTPTTEGTTPAAPAAPTAPEGSATGSATGTTTPSQPVGEAEQESRPEVAALADTGGVLTPQGHLIIEPSIELTHASVNRFTFRGVELQEVIQIGVIEASDADRNLISPALTARYGITNRLEVEAKVPYVYRTDRVTFSIPVLDDTELETQTLTGSGIGDIEAAAHYQITDGPLYVVGNLRFKSTTGEGPFDVDFDADGVAQELATGSGFYAIEPSVTLLFPSDPAIIFGTLSYQVNLPDSSNHTIGAVTVTDVDPGDAVQGSIGLGFALNEDLSFSLGYKHSYVFGTDTTIFNPATPSTRKFQSEELQVGSLLYGMSYRVTDAIRLNFDLELGVTADAPDVRGTLRVPVDVTSFF